MIELIHDEEFIDEFREAVLHKIRDGQDPYLYSKRYRIKLYLTSEEENRLKELANTCCKDGNQSSPNFAEWFIQAFIAGVAHNCRNVASSNRFCCFAIGETILAKPDQESSQYVSKKV